MDIKKNKRLFKLGMLNLFIFALLTFRIIQIQYLDSSKFKVMADSQYRYKENIGDLKYVMMDKNGKDLLQYNKKFKLVIDPGNFKRNNNSTDVNNLYAFNYILKNYNKDYDLYNILNSPNSAKLYFDLDEDTYLKLKQIKDIKGSYLYSYSDVDRKEAWKIENLLSNHKDIENKNKDENSLEWKIYSRTKENKTPSIIFEKDVDGSVAEGKYDISDKNINVRLTLDKDKQDAARSILQQDKYKAYDQIGVVLMEAKTGKIRVLAQKDESKPNINLAATTENGYVIGSIFKLVVEETALDKGLVSLNEKFVCKEGKDSLCKRAHGTLTMEEALIISCNNVFAEVGKRIGWDKIKDYAVKQGFFNKVLGLSGNEEVKGDFVEPKNYEDGPRFLSMGQNMRVTPVQAASIVGTIINEGVYMKPYIVEGFVDINNNMLEKVDTEKLQVLKKSTARLMKNEMIKVVRDEKGTGKNGYIKDIETGAKTGTTTRMEPKKLEDGSFSSEMEKHSDGWFAGYYRDRKGEYYSLIVFVKDINEEDQFGGSTAGPIFKELVENFTK